MEQQVSIVLIVPTKYVGLIIGKSGAFSKRILQGTDAQLVFQLKADMPENSLERAMAIFGSEQEICIVLTRIFEHIDKTSGPIALDNESKSADAICLDEFGDNDIEDGEVLVKWLISQGVCGSLIGKKGEGIKTIHRISGAWVKVAHQDEFSNKNGERLVYVRGLQEQVNIATQYIKDTFGGRRIAVGDETICSSHLFESVLSPIMYLPYLFRKDPSDQYPHVSQPSQIDPPIIQDSEIFIEPVGMCFQTVRLLINAEYLQCQSILSDLKSDVEYLDSIVSNTTASQNVSAAEATGISTEDDEHIITRSNRAEEATETPPDLAVSFEHAASSITIDLKSNCSSIRKCQYHCWFGSVLAVVATSTEWLKNAHDAEGRPVLESVRAEYNCFIQILPVACSNISIKNSLQKLVILAATPESRMLATVAIVKFLFKHRETAIPSLPIQAVSKRSATAKPTATINSCRTLGLAAAMPQHAQAKSGNIGRQSTATNHTQAQSGTQRAQYNRSQVSNVDFMAYGHQQLPNQIQPPIPSISLPHHSLPCGASNVVGTQPLPYTVYNPSVVSGVPLYYIVQSQTALPVSSSPSFPDTIVYAGMPSDMPRISDSISPAYMVPSQVSLPSPIVAPDIRGDNSRNDRHGHRDRRFQPMPMPYPYQEQNQSMQYSEFNQQQYVSQSQAATMVFQSAPIIPQYVNLQSTAGARIDDGSMNRNPQQAIMRRQHQRHGEERRFSYNSSGQRSGTEFNRDYYS